MPTDLSATAAGQSADRRAAAAAMVAADATGAIGRFADLVTTSGWSSNVSADKVSVFDAAGEVLDTRRYHVAVAGDETAGLASFATAQQGGLARRQAFEDVWEHGRRLVYGAVNAGGMGTEGRYGPFCLVVADPAASGPDALAVFPGDSAQRYTTASGGLDSGAALAEATAWADRADLAVVERGAEALATAEGSWSEVVCRVDHYLEAPRAGTLATSLVAEVRMRPETRARLEELRTGEVAGEALEPSQRGEVRAFQALLGWERAGGTRIVMVA